LVTSEAAITWNKRSSRGKGQQEPEPEQGATATARAYVCGQQETACQDILFVGHHVFVELEYCLHLRGKEEGCSETHWKVAGDGKVAKSFFWE
jgi:hypothetical protein